MVALLHAMILIPIVAWVVAFGYETWLALGESKTGGPSGISVYTHASWEITHTLLVYAFTVFIISYADALTVLDTVLFLPLCVFMVSIMLRGCVLLYLSASDNIKHPVAWQNLLSISYILSLISVLTGLVFTIISIRFYNLTPSVDNIAVVAVGFVLTAGLCSLPFWAVYRKNS